MLSLSGPVPSPPLYKDLAWQSFPPSKLALSVTHFLISTSRVFLSIIGWTREEWAIHIAGNTVVKSHCPDTKVQVLAFPATQPGLPIIINL
ncbi:hypothetical protein L6164_037504 [Bauhinia variegata]|uniref:Uncharacterized protein n=1 Tax=Bauhinia variegata TaxID=167791 RepID=A0ACB9KKH1_BAUVA|nr:hypothetical protein L6164_037504 [Bauhinia variegata]